MKKVENKKEEKLTFKQKLEAKKKEMALNWKALKKAIKDNPDMVPGIVGGIGTVLVAGGLMLKSRIDAAEEACHIQDDFIGSYWKTDHPLTNDELYELNMALLEKNENLGQALMEKGWLAENDKR